MKPCIRFALTAVLWLIPTLSSAQNLFEMLENHTQQNEAQMQQYIQQQQGIIQQQTQQIVQRTMQNPQVQERYRQYVAAGGTLTFPEYAYQYSATGGFSQQGMARYDQQTRELGQQNRQALQDYNAGQLGAMQEIQRSRDESFEAQTRDRGNALMGTTDYIDPSTGQRYKLPNSVERDTVTHDPQSGETVYNDPAGQRYRREEGDWWNELVEED